MEKCNKKVTVFFKKRVDFFTLTLYNNFKKSKTFVKIAVSFPAPACKNGFRFRGEEGLRPICYGGGIAKSLSSLGGEFPLTIKKTIAIPREGSGQRE